MAIMELVEKDIKARDIINEKSLQNALACDMALGCSSNSVLHLLAIANEAGVELNMEIFNQFSAKVPNLCHLAPAGGTHMHDLNNAGGLMAVFSELDKKGLIDIDYRQSLSGFDYSAYKGFPCHGSMALTQRGQTVVEMLELQGIGEE